jgi:hypothetical protein
MKIKNQKSILTRRNILIIVSLALVLSVAGFAYTLLPIFFPPKNNSDSTINYNPPTQEQKQAGNQTKEETINTPETKQEVAVDPASGKKQVSLTIVDAGQYDRVVEVRAFTGSVAETGGTCTITFTKGAEKLARTVPTIVSANSTQCTTLKVPTPEFPSLGTWSVVVAYESTQSIGQSSKQDVELK